MDCVLTKLGAMCGGLTFGNLELVSRVLYGDFMGIARYRAPGKHQSDKYQNQPVN